MRIHCPFCGVRDHSEFQYGGDAGKRMPSLEDDNWESWYDYVYVRDNPRGEHSEYWHHTHGCRHWVKVRRDTLSHRIGATVLARHSLGSCDESGEGGGDGA